MRYMVGPTIQTETPSLTNNCVSRQYQDEFSNNTKDISEFVESNPIRHHESVLNEIRRNPKPIGLLVRESIYTPIGAKQSESPQPEVPPNSLSIMRHFPERKT